MTSKKFLDELSQKISDAIPSSVRVVKEEIESNVHAALQGTFSKLDLITREEFDAQASVLAKTRKKLETLEKKVQELESQIDNKKTKKDK